jgi:hypothetical protein
MYYYCNITVLRHVTHLCNEVYQTLSSATLLSISNNAIQMRILMLSFLQYDEEVHL